MTEPTAEDRKADPNKYYKWMRRREAVREGVVAALEGLVRTEALTPVWANAMTAAHAALKEYEEANK